MTDSSHIVTGIWHCTYWYPSNEHVGDDPSEYDMRAHQHGEELVFESLPNEENSYMLVKLKLDGDVAIGSWHETTSPTGLFNGAEYSGSGQLIVDPGRTYMEGKWAGAGFDLKLQEMRVYTGNWELRRIADS